MEKLKDMKCKHDHKGTKILKLIIFSLVMLAPMFAILSKCLYTLNPNAKDSYSANETFTYYEKSYSETNTINSIDDLIIGNCYYFDFTELYNLDLSQYENIWSKDEDYIYGYFYFDDSFETYNVNGLNIYNAYGNANNITINNNIELEMAFELFISVDTTYFEIEEMSYDFFSVYINDISIVIQGYNNFKNYFVLDNNLLTLINSYMTIQNDYYFNYLDIIKPCPQELLPYIFVEQTIEQSTLDNAFYSAVDDLGNNQLFSWTKNTGIYTTINTMTTGLGINGDNNILAVLLTYWMLITAIYIVFDIIIEIFIHLTHLLNG